MGDTDVFFILMTPHCEHRNLIRKTDEEKRMNERSGQVENYGDGAEDSGTSPGLLSSPSSQGPASQDRHNLPGVSGP